MNVVLLILIYAVMAILMNRSKKKAKDAQDAKKTGNATPASDTKASHSPVRTTDGHTLTKEKDISCRRLFGHNHPEDNDARYLIHDDPGGEEYIILNGQRLRLKEADRHFCR